MSNNGWPNDPPNLVEIGVAGVANTGAVVSGAVQQVFQAFINDFHRTVEPLRTINGYRSRALNVASGGIETSNHRSGTALDLNGYSHPYEPSAAKPYNDGFTPAQAIQIRNLLARYPVIKWGMDFPRGYRDAMHFEIRGSLAAVSLVANTISTTPSRPSIPTIPTIPTIPGIDPIEEDDMPTADEIAQAVWSPKNLPERVSAMSSPLIMSFIGVDGVWMVDLAAMTRTRIPDPAALGFLGILGIRRVDNQPMAYAFTEITPGTTAPVIPPAVNASEIAALIVAQIGTGLATEVADELRRRLDS